ncbi:MAG: 50S ribosomal protein L21 [Phycisphaerales bacterium]|nr:50S ribosomal protein L21 [Phycisphaerales bacterium]
MYAIIEDSGTQIKVSSGAIIDIDLRDLADDAKTLTFDRVLAIGDGESAARIGAPYVAGVSVTADILDEIKGEKLHVFKYKRRKGSRRKIGHRQRYLRVRITGING